MNDEPTLQRWLRDGVTVAASLTVTIDLRAIKRARSSESCRRIAAPHPLTMLPRLSLIAEWTTAKERDS